jgi:hypothetical protein
LCGEENFICYFLVKIFSACAELSQLRALDVAVFHILVLWVNFKKLISLRIVNSIIVGSFKISFDRYNSSGMDMMETSFRHGVQ